MMEKIIDAGIGVHILWGIGVLGLILKIIVNVYMERLVKASENMATTRRKKLRIIRQKYENGKSLGINNGSGEAFVEKHIRRLRFAACPMEFWKRSGRFFSGIAVVTMASAFLYHDVGWRGSPEMVTFLANGVLVCAFLYVVENILLVNNKVEILKANIRDYLENIPATREVSPRAPAIKTVRQMELPEDNSHKLSVVKSDYKGAASANVIEDESAATILDKDREDLISDNLNPAVTENSQDVLNSFLKEFFS